MDNLQSHIASRFGQGPVARAAAQQAMRQLQQTDEEFQRMFEFNTHVPSGLAGQQDLLDAEALAAMRPAARPQQGRTNPGGHQAGSQYLVHRHSDHPPVATHYSDVDRMPTAQPHLHPPASAHQPQHSAASRVGPPRAAANMVQQAPGRQGSPNPVTSPPNRVKMAHVTRRSAAHAGSSGAPSGRPSSANPRPAAVPTPSAAQPRQPRAALAAKISGSAASQRAGSRPLSAPGPSSRVHTGAARAPSSARGGARHGPSSSPRAAAPAWATPVADANIDEASQLATALNGGSSEVGGATLRNTSPQSRPAVSQPVAMASPEQLPDSPQPDRSPSPRAGWSDQGFVSASYGQVRRSSEHSDEYFRRYRVKQHQDDQPDFKYSQPRSSGPHAVIQQKMYSFDEAHPAIAEQHYNRSAEQNTLLEKEREALAKKAKREELRQRQSVNKSLSPSRTPSVRQLHRDVSKMSRIRDVGNDRLNRLEQDGELLRHHSYEVQQRALEAIAASERITKQWETRSRTPSPGARSHSHTPYSAGSPGISPRSYGSPRDYPDQASPHDQGYDDDGAGYIQGPSRQHPPPAELGSLRPWTLPTAPPISMKQLINEASFQDDVDRLPQQEQPFEVETAVQAGQHEGIATLADHMALYSRLRASGSPGGPGGPTISEEEFKLAAGAFDPRKFDEYNRQVDHEMEQRALTGGYDSDVERGGIARRSAGMEDLAAAARKEEERKLHEMHEREQGDLQQALQSTWQDQNEWMDYYRERLGPEEGYHSDGRTASPSPERGAEAPHSTRSSPGPAGQQQYQYRFLTDFRSPMGSSGRNYDETLSEGDEALLGSPFVPILSPELGLSGSGYVSDGAGGYRRVHNARGHRPPRFKSTVPRPFNFDTREHSKPKTIMKVKFEQDMAIKQQEKEAAKKYRFKANPIPPTTVEPRYEHMMLEAEVRRQITRDMRMQELASMIEQPFSFQARDEVRAAERETLVRAAKDPNRFQMPFRARDVPAAVRHDKFKLMQMELEAKRAAASARIAAARDKARYKVEEDVKARQEAASRAYQERLRAVDPIRNQKYDTKPLGAVPDFDTLHGQWERQIATIRAMNRRRVTVPREFALNGAAAAEKAARDKKAQERRQRIILDMALDAELLPETRWPYMTPRGRTRPTPPPPRQCCGADPAVKVSETRANLLRRAHTQTAKRAGQYDSKTDKERRALEKARKEAMERAKAYMQIQDSIARKKGHSGNIDISALDTSHGLAAEVDTGDSQGETSKSTVAARREELSLRKDTPVQHIEARHAQVERKAKEMVEDALLQQGLDVYRYVEG